MANQEMLLHAEKGDIAKDNMRLVNHWVLSRVCDFIPSVIVPKPEDISPGAWYVQGTDGPRWSELIRDPQTPLSTFVSALTTMADQMEGLLYDYGVRLHDRHGNNILVELTAAREVQTVWQVDMKIVEDVLRQHYGFWDYDRKRAVHLSRGRGGDIPSDRLIAADSKVAGDLITLTWEVCQHHTDPAKKEDLRELSSLVVPKRWWQTSSSISQVHRAFKVFSKSKGFV